MVRRINSGIAGSGLDRRAISWIKEFALQNKLKGVVFTKNDGSLKIIAEGEENDLHRFSRVLEKADFFIQTENFYINWEESAQELGNFYFIS